MSKQCLSELSGSSFSSEMIAIMNLQHEETMHDGGKSLSFRKKLRVAIETRVVRLSNSNSKSGEMRSKRVDRQPNSKDNSKGSRWRLNERRSSRLNSRSELQVSSKGKPFNNSEGNRSMLNERRSSRRNSRSELHVSSKDKPFNSSVRRRSNSVRRENV